MFADNDIRVYRLHVHIALLALLIPVLAVFCGPAALVRLLTPRRPKRWMMGLTVDAITSAVARKLHHPLLMRRRRCLRRAMTLHHCLRAAGLPSAVHFGLQTRARPGRRFHGHCWVTLDGRVLADGPSEGMYTIFSFGTEAHA